MNKKEQREIAIVAIIILGGLYFNGSLSNIQIGNYTFSIGGGLTAGAPSASNTTIIAGSGQSTTFMSHVTGGTTPYTFEWYRNSSRSPACTPANVILGANGNPIGGVNTTRTPLGNGYYTYSVSDSESPSVWKCAGLGVYIAVNQIESLGTPIANTTTITLGQSVKLTVNITGGEPPYTIQWYGNSTTTASCNGTNILNGTTGYSVIRTPIGTGIRRYSYSSSDKSGTWKCSPSVQITVTGSPTSTSTVSTSSTTTQASTSTTTATSTSTSTSTISTTIPSTISTIPTTTINATTTISSPQPPPAPNIITALINYLTSLYNEIFPNGI